MKGEKRESAYYYIYEPSCRLRGRSHLLCHQFSGLLGRSAAAYVVFRVLGLISLVYGCVRFSGKRVISAHRKSKRQWTQSIEAF
ncbi:MAG: hypothetical protein ACP5TI_05185 [Thermoprotei archaeon]